MARSVAHPTFPLITGREHLGVKDLGQYLQTFNDTRPRPVEILIAVGNVVAFMGTADKEVAGAQRTNDLRRARDERNHAFGRSIGQVAQMLLPGNDEDQKADGRRRRLPSWVTGCADVSLGSQSCGSER